ncbi:MAG: FapA family protein [Thermodesulfobacteriota bacterium]
MAADVVITAEGDRILVRVGSGFSGRFSELVAQVREKIPGLAVDWTAVREAYLFGRDRPFPVASRDPAETLAEKAKIRFSPDGLTAYLLLFPPKPRGRRMEEPQLQALAAAYGVPAPLVDAGALRRAHLHRGSLQPQVLARGRPPVDGHPAWIHWYEGHPSDPEGFLAAYRDQGDYPDAVLAECRPGQAVGDYHPPGAGAAGTSVRGDALAPCPGRDLTQLGPGLRRDEARRAVVAEAAGHLRLTGIGSTRAEVVPLLRVADAQELRAFAGGVFPGSVVVDGDLEAGFPVRILGDLEVRGALIRSPVEVLGSLFVRDGVIQKGRAPVRVGGLAVAAFLDHASLQAQTVLIRRYSLKSQVLALESVLTADSGSIQGGSAGAGRELRLGTLGSGNAMATEAAAGAPQVADAFRALYLDWSKALGEAPAEGQAPPPEAQAAAAHWRARAEALATLDPSEARVAAQTVHAGVTVRVGTAARTVDNPVGPAEFLFERVGGRGRVALSRL